MNSSIYTQRERWLLVLQIQHAERILKEKVEKGGQDTQHDMSFTKENDKKHNGTIHVTDFQMFNHHTLQWNECWC